jgi:hypothetical protein
MNGISAVVCRGADSQLDVPTFAPGAASFYGRDPSRSVEVKPYWHKGESYSNWLTGSLRSILKIARVDLRFLDGKPKMIAVVEMRVEPNILLVGASQIANRPAHAANPNTRSGDTVT